MKYFKNRFFLGSLCILLGLAISFFVIPRLAGNNQAELVSAVRLKTNLAKGQRIAPADLETIRLAKNILPQGYLSEIEDQSDLTAMSDLFAGDVLTLAKISESKEKSDPMLRATNKGLQVISISLPGLAQGVSGKLKAGDVVTVIALPRQAQSELSQTLPLDNDANPETQDSDLLPIPGSIPKTLIYPELQYLEICSVHASDGSDARVEQNPTAEQKNILPQTVSLFVNKNQALRLAELEQTGLIHLSFVARAEDAAAFIEPARLVYEEN